jgi:hypothetical protein
MRALALFLLAGCATVARPAPDAAPAAEPAALEAVKQLAGTWVLVGEDGRPTQEVVSEYRLTAAGSAVIETLFPGQEHEMVSMYYESDGRLLCTHYCAFGNHPVLAVTYEPASGELRYDCVGAGANFRDCATTPHMHQGRAQLTGADRMRTSWQAWVDGAPAADHQAEFELARVK